jgi:hypothetical protein
MNTPKHPEADIQPRPVGLNDTSEWLSWNLLGADEKATQATGFKLRWPAEGSYRWFAELVAA